MPNPLAGVHNYAEPDWTPLERAMALLGRPVADCDNYMWMLENPAGVHQHDSEIENPNQECQVCGGEGFLFVILAVGQCIKRCEACGAFDTDESARRYVESHSADLGDVL